MIEFTKAYKTEQGTFATLREAQKAELVTLMSSERDAVEDTKLINRLADVLLDKADKVVNCLTTTPNSRPKARKANGAKRAGKAKAKENLVEVMPTEA